jgi:hypothetical protein
MQHREFEKDGEWWLEVTATQNELLQFNKDKPIQSFDPDGEYRLMTWNIDHNWL